MVIDPFAHPDGAAKAWSLLVVHVHVCVSPGTQHSEKWHSMESSCFLLGCQLQVPHQALGVSLEEMWLVDN